jgi:methylated-DNA-[protein]-cysteine S-methyltransferase
MHCYDFYQSPHGRMLLVAADGALSGVYFEGQKYHPPIDPAWRADPRHPVLQQASRELAEYFAGERRQFETPLAPAGTAFQRAVWAAIATVGYGTTITYAELARRAGCPGSARAAGAATGRNPLTILVPCHRILDSRGGLNGYAGGLDRKRALLVLECAWPAGAIPLPLAYDACVEPQPYRNDALRRGLHADARRQHLP